MTKHTQGQWVQYGTSVRAADNDATIASVQANYGESHATFGSVDEINYSEQVANARLISAAPELLAALIECVEYMQNRNDAYRSAMAAIAKATQG